MIVIDNFIKDKNLLLEIESDFNFFPKSIGSGQYEGRFTFWNGWWDSPADNTRKKLIKAIWENNLPIPIKDISGFEYWIRTYANGESIPFHFDEDVLLYKQEKIFQGSTIGCIYFPESNAGVVGGFLEIHKNKMEDGTFNSLERENIEPLVSSIEERERIACKPNRLIIFDGGHNGHNSTPVINGNRIIFGVSIWHKDKTPRAVSSGKAYFE
jgi:hypothetical protein